MKLPSAVLLILIGAATAADDARRTVRFRAGLREESCTVECSWRFFTEKTVPSRKETVRIRFDTRKVFWSDAIADAAAWVSATPGYEPLDVPADASAPSARPSPRFARKKA